MKLFKNAMVLINDKFEKLDFLTDNGKFLSVESDIKNADNCDVVDLNGKHIIAGLIDIHTHGGFGVDFNSADKNDVLKVCHYYNEQGVTSVLPTILSDTKETTIKSIKTVVSAKEECDTIIGIHLEGPFLSKEFKGAMPEHLLLEPDVDLFLEYQKASGNIVKLTTVSPELTGACDFAKRITETGVICSLGHSGASQEQVFEFIDSGATNATHLGNAMKQPTQHNLNVCGSVLYTDIYAEIICDGFHINPTVIDYWFKVKDHDKIIAITDCIMAAGLCDGEYMLGVNEVVVTNGDAKLKYGNSRAGSTLKAINAVKNISKFINIPFEQAVKFMTVNPAKSLGIFDEYGSVEASKFANFLVLDENNDILETYVKGNCVYKA